MAIVKSSPLYTIRIRGCLVGWCVPRGYAPCIMDGGSGEWPILAQMAEHEMERSR